MAVSDGDSGSSRSYSTRCDSVVSRLVIVVAVVVGCERRQRLGVEEGRC